MRSLEQSYAAAARLIDDADSLVICAGAGIGVDSGLPDFRGPSGFWQVYPALGRAKIRFEEIASPAAFKKHPTLAWGFYGHRLRLYRDVVPHEGFRLLRTLAESMPHGGFVFTSNVDGQFQKAGFPESRVVECHGSIHHLQCLDRCSDAIWTAANFEPEVDQESCQLISEMPRCPDCGALARPAILMFSDWEWAEGRTRLQSAKLTEWRRSAARPVVIEIGAGSAIATVRHFSHSQTAPLVRINPTEWQVPHQSDIGIPTGALEGVLGIWSALNPGSLDFTTSNGA
jgi:NAD-dependent SIR2 family protein deacetylase